MKACPSAPVLVRFSRLRLFPTSAVRAILKAQELFGFALGLSFLEFREKHGKLGRSFVDRKLDALAAQDAVAVRDILRARLAKLPERRRPHYTPRDRFRIPELKERNSWSASETARLFLLSPNTIYGWLAEVNHESETVGSLVRPDPPVQCFADTFRHLVRTLDRLGFGGNLKLAQVLARAGYRLSARSVGRIRQEFSPPTPIPKSSRRKFLKARYPNHIFMADVTQVPSRFRLFRFHIALVLDVFSRLPLAWKVFFFKPSSRKMTKLLRTAVRRFGAPRYFVSDRGTEFTGSSFRHYLKRLGVRHRFGAIGQKGSIALIERFWRTLKQSLHARYPAPPLRLAELEERLRLELLYYAHFRPHQALDGATPAEVYYRTIPLPLNAVRPPRARPREGPNELPVHFVFLDPEQRLPILIRTAA